VHARSAGRLRKHERRRQSGHKYGKSEYPFHVVEMPLMIRTPQRVPALRECC
jgi:hypothetical protein